ncbi:MAG: energy-coupling factor ABC transporter substrate-binding protein [Rhodospirillaceae bacterium]
MTRRNVTLLGVALVIALLPLLLTSGAAFKGSDDQATAAIAALAPGYRPWAVPLWTPPGPEVESLLFSLQAALGAGVIGYYLGWRRGRQQRREDRPRAGD